MTLPSQNTPGPDHAAPRPPFAKRAAKFLIGAGGLASQILAAGILEEREEFWVQLFLGALAAYGIYKVPNKKDPTVP